MLPPEINNDLKRSVIGQSESLKFVSVAIFKHLQGEPFGNLMLIGSSGTGKTTIMRAVERFYAQHDEFQKYRIVVIMNAKERRVLVRRLDEKAVGSETRRAQVQLVRPKAQGII